MTFNLNDAWESKHENPSLSEYEQPIEHQIDIKNISDSYLLNMAPKSLSDIQKKIRKKLTKKIYYNKKKIKSESKQDIDINNISDTCLLKTPSKLLSPMQKKYGKT